MGRESRCCHLAGEIYLAGNFKIVKVSMIIEIIQQNASLKGNLAAIHATKKGKAAIGTVLNITRNLKGDNWPAATKLFHSIARTSVTYLAHIGCFSTDYLEHFEICQLYFYKRLLSLPACIPGYAIRYEINLDHTAVWIIRAAIG
ncbi:hypothetical protein KQX54_013806 [Cotesia glomerata]|uniref:Uncharacterized protein n=1 Tax=Cotesia glomerata TaxID=32391 RepID=A0AAV7ILF9_COTGL|nr:hypothetical protein KQX54_013806 [Cotesia glomerata]